MHRLLILVVLLSMVLAGCGRDETLTAPTVGSCCLTTGTCSVTTQANCTGTGTWTSAGVCDPNSCPQPDGACCALAGTCTVTTRANCTGTSTWTEAGVCGTNTCTPPPLVLVSNIWPHSPYGTGWWTDADPIIVVELRAPGGQVVDPHNLELMIDGDYWATWIDDDDSADYVRGNGAASLEYTSQDQSVLELVYHHSTYPRDGLAHGAHRLTVRFKVLDGTDDWIELNDYPFSVDRTSPIVEAGGFVSSPYLVSVLGYINPQHRRLLAKLYDDGGGILFQPDRPWYYPDLDCDGILDPDERRGYPVSGPDSTWLDPATPYVNCWIQTSPALKYDVWRIRRPDPPPPGDHPDDNDNIEVRTLLHMGTLDELEPWMTQNGMPISLDEYDPTDTLAVLIPVVGGGVIEDNDIVEITWYSEASIEQNSDGPGWDCVLDTVGVNGSPRIFWDTGCAYDSESLERRVYNEGVRDWAFNSSAKYVAQRFVVDMSCPVVNILQPMAPTVDAAEDMQIEVSFADAGVGVDPPSASVTVLDPSGNQARIDSPTFINDRFTGVIAGPLQRGEYTIRAAAADLLGAACESSFVVTTLP